MGNRITRRRLWPGTPTTTTTRVRTAYQVETPKKETSKHKKNAETESDSSSHQIERTDDEIHLMGNNNIRLTYISLPVQVLSQEEIDKIIEVSQKNNAKRNITGVVYFSSDIIIQTLEGDEDSVMELVSKISKDPRHKQITIASLERGIKEKLYPQWKMNNVMSSNPKEQKMISHLLSCLATSLDVVRVYTPQKVLKDLQRGENPLQQKPMEIRKVIIFADIVSYSKLTETLGNVETFLLADTFARIASEQVKKHGGDVNKFIGDCIVASFYETEVDASIQCAIDIISSLKQLRQNSAAGSSQRELYCGVGMAIGDVVEGNMGIQDFRLDNTFIGNAVNIASRVESQTRALNVPLLVTSELVSKCSNSDLVWLNMGEIELKNIENPETVYSLDMEF
eukprot:gb/GECH01012726.1/.p1 GENE.gb/GECH01012726.1/~~gb/GECH01012726.1/.p1  ORF type:complete len:396 (+),score=55.60 gb/GECH01012726.1/:1-1188(+)